MSKKRYIRSDANLNQLSLILACCLMVLFAGCSSDNFEEEIEGEETETKNNFEGPIYPDDYTPIASWEDREKWDLANVHDPSVVQDDDVFYMVSTDASYGNAHKGHGHFLMRKSKDLVNWDFVGMVFSDVPAWIKDSLNNKRVRMDPSLQPIENPEYGFWAPDIQKVGNTFRMYYAVVVLDPIVGDNPETSWTERAFIGLAETDNLTPNEWEDKGMVISSIADHTTSYERNGPNDWESYFKYNAIDPSFVESPDGEQWLVYGSWHSGIVIVRLNPETGKPYRLKKLEDYGDKIAGREAMGSSRWQALEAPEIIYNDETGYYYLFLAYDELSVAYNTRVARSKDIRGPYLGVDGANVTEGAEAWPMLTHSYAFNGHPGWVGISHPAVFKDTRSDQWFYASQARLPEGVSGINASNAIMMGHVRKIEWTADGWPVVFPERYANVPENEKIRVTDILGTWEIIDLEYNYRQIDQSTEINLKEKGRVVGELTGKWSFDEEKGILKIDQAELFVSRAWDWEKHPRGMTLTFSGLDKNGKTIWGKKKE